MSTEWYYRLRAPLAFGAPQNTERFLDAARRQEIWFPDGPRLLDEAPTPCFGPGTSYDGSRFRDIVGISAENGELLMGIHCQNLLREPYEGDDGMASAAGTRMEQLLGFLSKMTVGEPGDVVGCIASEHDDWSHAHPLVRCTDNVIRIAYTSTSDESCGYGHDPEEIELPARIPRQFLSAYPSAYSVSLDVASLREKYVAVEHAAPNRETREDMKQIAAISAFDGLTPSPAFNTLRERYISGKISIKDFREEIDSRWKPYG